MWFPQSSLPPPLLYSYAKSFCCGIIFLMTTHKLHIQISYFVLLITSEDPLALRLDNLRDQNLYCSRREREDSKLYSE